MAFYPVDPTPFWGDLKKYPLSWLRGDLMAALQVALMALPQAVAYAFLAGLPISAGIWAAVFGTFFTAAFGQSRYLVAGSTNMVAILLQSGTSEILYTYYSGASGTERDVLALKIVLQIVLLIGLFQVIAGLLRLGRLTQFTSRSVIIGYVAGAAIAIAVSQLYPFFGIPRMEGYHPIYQQGWYLLGHLYTLHLPTTLLAVGCLVLLVIFYRTSRKIPGAAIVFILAALVVFMFNLAPTDAKGTLDVIEGEQIERVTLIQDIAPSLKDIPRFSLPTLDFRILPKLVPLAFAIALLTVLQATAIGRSFTSSKEPPYNDNQEIYGLGLGNFLSAFFGGMPSSGSFSRSALNKASGAKTRFAAMGSGVCVFILILVFDYYVGKIPLATLATLMLFTAATMVNIKELFICLRATRMDAFVVLVTLGSSLIFTLDVALYIGVVVSIVLYLKQAAIPHLIEYAFNNVGKLRPLEMEDERPDPAICIIQAEGELFFGSADLLQTKLRNIAEDENLKVIIIQLLNTRFLDASCCLALRQVLRYLKATKRTLMLSGVSPEVWGVLDDSHLLYEIGEANCFAANEQLPSEPTRNAYAQAKSL